MRIEPFLSEARWETYRVEAARTGASAESLYVWNTQLAAALYEVLAHLECALRETIDTRLREWNAEQEARRFSPDVGPGPDWALPGRAAAPLRAMVTKRCREASGRVRSRRVPGHDDVVAQLSFGIWITLIPKSSTNAKSSQFRLWEEALVHAFPHIGEGGPEYLYRRLARLRDLRNRIAHHENLLAVKAEARLTDVLAILACIDQQLADYVAGVSQVREVAAMDPRK